MPPRFLPWELVVVPVSRYSNISSESKQEAPANFTQTIEGTFVCQTCFEDVGEAKLFRAEQLLMWTCSDGHKSWVEDFIL